MLSPEDRLRWLVEEIVSTDDPMHALEALVDLRVAIEGVTRAQAAKGLREGHSFGELARALRISRQAAHRRFRDLSPAPLEHVNLVATEDAGQVLRLARDEAQRADAIALGSEHVVMAALRSATPVARVLREHGASLDAARRSMRESGPFSARAPEPGGPAAGIRRVLQDAAHVAVTRGRARVGADAVLLAALTDLDDGARLLLVSLRVDVASVRAALETRIRTQEPRRALRCAS